MRETLALDIGGTRVTLVRSARRRRTVQVQIDPVRGVVVMAPKRTPLESIRAIVDRRAGWIARHVEQRPERQLVSGESLPLLGDSLPLTVCTTARSRSSVAFDGGGWRVSVPDALGDAGRRAAIERALQRWYRRRAETHLAARVAHWSEVAGYMPGRLVVGNARFRWGSCAASGTLRFNWRLMLAPTDVVDYVVVHEIAHLRVRNHSAAFWREVARILPDFAGRRASLRGLAPTLVL